MIKSTLINWGTKRYLKNNGTKRSSVPFSKAKKIGIIFDGKTKQDEEAINGFVKNLKQQGKEVSVFRYDQKNNEGEKGVKTFSLSDIKWNGVIKSYGLKKLIRTEFDYLFSLNTSPILLLENVLARSQAKCRVGSVKGSGGHCELAIHARSNNSIKELLENMIQYTQMIKK